MGRLNEFEVDHVIDTVPLKAEGQLDWTERDGYMRARTNVMGAGFKGRLRLDVSISVRLPGKYALQLHQPGGTVLRRLDVRSSHTNRPETGAPERWRQRTHKHRWSDTFEDAIAYTPTDIPDTSSPVHAPEPGAHEAVYMAFCDECGLDPSDSWTDPPLSHTPSAN